MYCTLIFSCFLGVKLLRYVAVVDVEKGECTPVGRPLVPYSNI